MCFSNTRFQEIAKHIFQTLICYQEPSGPGYSCLTRIINAATVASAAAVETAGPSRIGGSRVSFSCLRIVFDTSNPESLNETFLNCSATCTSF